MRSGKSRRWVSAAAACAVVMAWCGLAEARVGLARVVCEGSPPSRKLAQRVEDAAMQALSLHGATPPPPAEFMPSLHLAQPTDSPTAAQCVSAGRMLHLDAVVVILISRETRMVESEVRIVVTGTGEEYLYAVRETTARTPRRVGALLDDIFGDVRAWDDDLARVERALGKDEDRLFARYARSEDAGRKPFPRYAYDRAERRRNLSLGLGLAFSAVIATGTALLGVGTRGIWDDPASGDDDSTDVCIACGIGEIIVYAARVLVVCGLVIGFAGTALTAIAASVLYKRRENEMRRLEPLVAGARAAPAAVSWHLAPYPSPTGGGISLLADF
jgi:hypothetical protein